MNVLQQGKYSGTVKKKCASGQVTATVTSYNEASFNKDRHCHQDVHFSYLVCGGCVEKKKFSYEITPGNLTYYESGEIHEVVNIPMPAKRVNIEISDLFFSKLAVNRDELKKAVMTNPDARITMVKIYRELLRDDNDTPLCIDMLLAGLFRQVNRYPAKAGTLRWLGILTNYLHDHIEDATSLQQLAELTGLHPVTLSKQFPVYFGCTIGEYKRKIKVAKSLTILHRPDLSLTSVAYDCGFYDQAHFIKAFKHNTGMLPKLYRCLQKYS